jgi:hypothetical protein
MSNFFDSTRQQWDAAFMIHSRTCAPTFMTLAIAVLLWAPSWSRAVGAEPPDPPVKMFVWWNAAYKQKEGFTAESFSRNFTRDAVMRINGKDVCTEIEDMAKHFQDIQARTEMVVVVLPSLDAFTSPNRDRIFTHHFVRARERGKNSRERVMGFVEIKNGQISLVACGESARHGNSTLQRLLERNLPA